MKRAAVLLFGLLTVGGWSHPSPLLRQSEPEQVLADQVPGGGFVSVGVGDKFEFTAVVLSPAGKIVRKLDAAPLWDSEKDFVPSLVCALDDNRILVLDQRLDRVREGKIYSLRTGNVEKEVQFPALEFSNFDRLKDGTLLGESGGDFLHISQDGTVMWRKSVTSILGARKDKVMHHSVVKVTPAGEIAVLESDPDQIRLFDSNFKPLRTLALARAGKWFNQRMAPVKNGFWVELFEIEDGALLHVDMSGNPSKPRVVKLADGSTIDYAIVLGELSSGEPVIYEEGLCKVDPRGVATSIDGLGERDDDLSGGPARR